MATKIDGKLKCGMCWKPIRRGRKYCSVECFKEARKSGMVMWKPKSGRDRRWTAHDDAYVAEWAGKKRARDIAEHLGRTMSAVHQRIRKLKLSHGSTRWTQEDEDWLRDNYHRQSFKFMSKKLDRSRCSIKQKAEMLGVKRRTSDILTVNDLSMITGYSRHSVLTWIQRGHLKASKSKGSDGNGLFEVHPRDFRAYMGKFPGSFKPETGDLFSLIDLLANGRF